MPNSTAVFPIILQASGLSQREAATFLGVRHDTVRKWGSGARDAPAGAVAELHKLIVDQMRAAHADAGVIMRGVTDSGGLCVVNISTPADDDQARALGWPTVSAHAAVIGLTLALLPPDVAQHVRIVNINN